MNRGFLIDENNRLIPRNGRIPQIIKNEFIYSENDQNHKNSYNLIKVINSLGQIKRYEYNDFNQTIKSWDFDNHWIENIYNIPSNPSPENPICYDLIRSRRQEIINIKDDNDPNNFIESSVIIEKFFEYKKYDIESSRFSQDFTLSTHRLTKEIDERRKEWVYTYDDDASNRSINPTMIRSPNGLSKKLSYNERGECISIFDQEENEYRYYYDKLSRIEKIEHPSGRNIIYTYYPNSPWLKMINNQNTTIEFIRDCEGKIITIIDQVKQKIDYNYNDNSRLESAVFHRPSINYFDNYSNLSIEEYSDLVFKIEYTPLGKVRSYTNPKNQEIVFIYDENDRLTCWYYNHEPMKKICFIYNSLGQLSYRSDKDGNIIKFHYDNIGNLKKIEYPEWFDGSTSTGKIIEFNHDLSGRVISLNDSEITGTQYFCYDQTGNLRLRKDQDGYELEFNYDDDNRLSSIRDYKDEFKLDIILDELGRPSRLTDSEFLDGALTWEYKYEKEEGSLIKKLGLFERKIPAIGLISEFNYDERNNLNHIIHSLEQNGQNNTIFKQDLSYRFDSLINRITGDLSNSFNYDGLKNLIYEENDNLFSDYDEIGNRKFRSNLIQDPNPSQNLYNIVNQIITNQNPQIEFKYDDNGNVNKLSRPGETLQLFFDAANRLRKVLSNSYEISYLYNYKGQLIERKYLDKNTNVTTNLQLRYLFKKPILIYENDKLKWLLIWDLHRKLLRIKTLEDLNGDSYPRSLFPLYDGLRNIVRYIDSDQNICAKIEHDVWGNIKQNNSPLTNYGLFAYKSGFYDSQTGFMLFGERWYFPLVGRWISQDPSIDMGFTEQIQTFSNLYRFTKNNPLIFIDPSGLKEELLLDDFWEEPAEPLTSELYRAEMEEWFNLYKETLQERKKLEKYTNSQDEWIRLTKRMIYYYNQWVKYGELYHKELGVGDTDFKLKHVDSGGAWEWNKAAWGSLIAGLAVLAVVGAPVTISLELGAACLLSGSISAILYDVELM